LARGFDIVEFDRWLAALEECGAKADLSARRTTAKAAVLANKHDAAFRHLEWMLQRWNAIRREEALLPLARAGKTHSVTQAARRKDKPAEQPDDAGRNERIRKIHARLVARGDDDATSQVAVEFGLSTRQVRRILSG
jgi:hypothetical protein